MTRQEKIDKIYEVIADKTLSFGCKIQDDEYGIVEVAEAFDERGKIKYPSADIRRYYLRFSGISGNFSNSYVLEMMKVIGHPVMFGDCAEFIVNSVLYFDKSPIYLGNDIVDSPCLVVDAEYLLSIRTYMRKPIEDQSDECIDFIYGLINYED